jgi:hypothetical protein
MHVINGMEPAEQPQLTPGEIAQSEALAAAEQVAAAGERRAERPINLTPTNADVIDEGAVNDVQSISKNLVPGPELPEDERREALNDIGELYNEIVTEGDSTEEEAIGKFVTILTRLGFRRNAEGEENVTTDEDIAKLFPGINPNQREKIIAQLDPITDEEKARREAISDDDADRLASRISALGHKAEAVGEILNARLQGEIDQLPPEGQGTDEEQKRRRQLTEHQSRANKLITRVTNLFSKGEPGKDFVRRLGKTLSWTAIIMMFFVLLEMRWIHNSVGKWNR